MPSTDWLAVGMCPLSRQLLRDTPFWRSDRLQLIERPFLPFRANVQQFPVALSRLLAIPMDIGATIVFWLARIRINPRDPGRCEQDLGGPDDVATIRRDEAYIVCAVRVILFFHFRMLYMSQFDDEYIIPQYFCRRK